MKYYWILMIVFPILEALWDGFHELKRNQSPDYFLSNVYRVIGGLIFLSLMIIFDPQGMSILRIVTLSLGIVTSYSVIFDGSLNILRTWYGIPNRPYYYLGQGSDLDQWQIAYGGAKLWFWIKVGVAISSVTLFEFLPYI